MELAALPKKDPDHSDSSCNSVGTTTGRTLQRQACGGWRDRINNFINNLFGDDPQMQRASGGNSEEGLTKKEVDQNNRIFEQDAKYGNT